MKEELHFNQSSAVSIGIELEFQIINPKSFSLVSCAKEILDNIQEKKYQLKIKPELTQSMLEINSSVHSNIQELAKELQQLYHYLLLKSSKLGIVFCGGGTHPFHKWTNEKIFLTKENKSFARKYKYLAKQATVFGQHVHIGCLNAEEALYLTHALARFIPHFIAISASSPFYWGVDTGFFSSRTTVFNAFPLSGVIPFLINWNEFSDYFYKMKKLNVIKYIDDFLWDIRLQPKFGTVEVRVCDAPLTLEKALLITSYIQTLSLYLLEEKPFEINHNLYYLYNHNRFQSSRYGFKGTLIDPFTSKHRSIAEDILITFKKIKKYAHTLQNDKFLIQLKKEVEENNNDTSKLREIFKRTNSFEAVVAAQCEEWQNTKID